LQIFNSAYQTEFTCFADCNATVSFAAPEAGTYFVFARYYEANYTLICENNQTITVTQGGNGCTDADGDGYCEADDCDDNNATIPATPGTACDDGDATTISDEIQADGCTCEGTPVSPGDPNCEIDISITTDVQGITVDGLDGAPVTSLQVFNAFYQTEFSCFADCNATEFVAVSAGTYFVYAKYYDAAYNLICEKIETVVVGTASIGQVPNGLSESEIIAQIQYLEKEQATEVTEIIEKGDISIYPNPAVQLAHLEVSDFAGQRGTIIIYDVLGKLIQQQDYDELPSEAINLNLSEYRSGVYHIAVAVEGRRLMTKKLVIQN